ncbi:protein PET117 homolog, mitochondrial [Nothoprocta perdicaria]|uniref:protein PET117 homolog, mitochondrial n=1 Tax=Nothoprocta perdicaria TaxID=30464 RepID=UPI000E1BB82C|nr:protein PET117 homolog, mitochondrial [Nothoprocta perdicaria]
MVKGSRELKICKVYFQRLHRGVLRDLERLSQKEENIRRLEEQIALTKQLKEERDKMLLEEGSQHS